MFANANGDAATNLSKIWTEIMFFIMSQTARELQWDFVLPTTCDTIVVRPKN